MTTFRYFGYGSNMLTQRLTAANRCPNARLVGVATVEAFHLDFSKRSKRDGSGKATLRPRNAGRVYGVLFDIPLTELDALNREEGLNSGYYLVDDFKVSYAGETVTARAYLAEKNEEDLRPFDWYLALTVAGAHQHQIPADYVANLRATPYTVDNDLSRASRKEALNALHLAGFGTPAQVLSQ